MEYTGYTPDLVRKDKAKNLMFIILVFFPLLLGLFVGVYNVIEIASISVVDVSTISYADMNDDDEYYFGEMILVDGYAEVTNSVTGAVQSTDYLVYFYDQNGTGVYTTFRAEGASDISERCRAYLEDDSLMVGDVILSGCFHAWSNSSDYYFDEAYDYYSAQLPGEMLEMRFYYDDMATVDEYRSDEVSRKLPTFFVAALFIVPSVIGLLILLRKRKALNQYLEYYNRHVPASEA